MLQVLGSGGRVFAVLAAPDVLAEDKGRAARAVVGAGAVVMDAASELGEHQQDDVVAHIVGLEVVHEGGDAFGDVLPQLVVHPGLVGVAVEAAVVAVEDARAKVGHVDLGYPLELVGQRGVGVLDVGGVLLRGHLEDVGGGQGVEAGLAQVVHDETAADGG